MKGLGDTRCLRASIHFPTKNLNCLLPIIFVDGTESTLLIPWVFAGLVGIDVLAQTRPLEPYNRRRSNALIPICIITVFEVRTSTSKQYWRSYHLARSFQPFATGDEANEVLAIWFRCKGQRFATVFAGDENLCSASSLHTAFRPSLTT